MSLPSSTVENYLKAILQAQLHLERRTDLVPMGQLAAALRVVPGTVFTATSMAFAMRFIETERSPSFAEPG